jgi:nucleoside 2-deoxyribosyltransferase
MSPTNKFVPNWLKPRIYLAGKIEKNCFRHSVVKGLRESLDDASIETERFVYTGPFFYGCDHGCCHGPSTHGRSSRGCTITTGRHDTYRRCLRGIRGADLVIAYITSNTCYGTLFELGIAEQAGKIIIAMYSPEMAAHRDDLWFCEMSTQEVHLDVSREAFPTLLDRVIDKYAGGDYGSIA